MSWINTGIAAVGVATSIAGAVTGSNAAKKAAKQQKRLALVESRQNMIAMRRQHEALLGIQQTGYAAAGVSIDVGAPKAVQEQGQQDFVESNYYEALKLHYVMKGATAAGNAASSGYLSQGISQGLGFAASGISAYNNRTPSAAPATPTGP